ncbi:hypothetical protein [Gracilimonas tropica]|uniref:hypothetical protein n=1 Tax=Gracilimonas tropica TaxID=454600 RepID=UPI00035DC013|nr:hypothetical protein [Gracilimonas tropica]
MNTQLEELLSKAKYYTPAKKVELAAGETKTVRFQGLNAKRYGVNRLAIGGTGLDYVMATLAFNNGRDKKIDETSLSALRKLFLARSLRGALIVEKATELFVTLTNTDNTAHTVNVQLIGYDDEHLMHKMDSYEANGIEFPQPEFVYITKTIASGVGQQRFSVNLPSHKLRLYRMAVSTTGTEDEIQLSIRQDRTRIKPEVFLSQINDEFEDKDIILPATLQAHTPFDLFVTNTGAGAHTVSFIAECYRV